MHASRYGAAADPPAGRHRYPGPQARSERRRVHAQRRKHFPGGVAVERGPRRRLDQEPQQHGIQVTVFGDGPRRVTERLPVEQIERAASGGDHPVERQVGRQSAGVVEQHPHRNPLAAGSGEARQVPRNRRIEGNPPLIHQHQDRARRGDDLGERGEVPAGVADRSRPGPGRPGDMPEARGVQDGIAPADHDHRAGIDAFLNALLHHARHRREAGVWRGRREQQEREHHRAGSRSDPASS